MATAMATAPSQTFMASYQRHLDELKQWEQDQDGIENGAKEEVGGCCDPCALVCCCCRAGCISALPCCGPGESAGHQMSECSCCCCLGWMKMFTCLGKEVIARCCEQSCICYRPCRTEFPFENWSTFQYIVMGAIDALGKNIPVGNIHAVKGLTTLPYGTAVFRQIGLKVEEVSVKNAQGRTISGAWIEPAGAPPDKVLLYFSGGAFVLQNEAAARWYTGFFAKYLGWKMFSANYGHPPQEGYLDIMDGLVRTWDWLMEQGIKPENVVIGGDSAGGNLSISLALRLRYSEAHREKGQPAGLLLFSPWVNMYPFSSKSYKKNAPYDYISHRGFIQLMVDMYVEHHDPLNPLFSLYRMPEEELAELPPVFVSTGKAEVLNWSINEFFTKVAKARTHAINDEFHNAPGMPHVYQMLACTHPFPDVEYVPCLCRRLPCVAPCCGCGHCLVASDPEKAKEHETYKTLEKMKVFLKKLE